MNPDYVQRVFLPRLYGGAGFQVQCVKNGRNRLPRRARKLRYNQKSVQIEPISLHHLGPCRHEIPGEFRRCIVLCIGLGKRSELRV